MRFFLATMLLIASASSVVSAENIQTDADQMVVVGAGSVTCGNFAEQYRANPSRTEEFFTSWLLGFLTGLNAMSSLHHLHERDFSPALVGRAQSFVRSYCNEHPLAMYIEAATQYAGSLPLRP